MARGCSGSESEEEERHDRFKSERNASLVKPLFRSLPSSLDNYTSRSRSPLRSNSSKTDRYKTKHSVDSILPRRDRSRERKRSRERRSPKEHERNSGSSEDKKSTRRANLEKKIDNGRDRYDIESRIHREVDGNNDKTCKDRDHKCKDRERKRRSREKERNSYISKRDVKEELREEKISKSERHSSNSDSDYLKDDCVDDTELEVLKLPRYYEIVDESIEDPAKSSLKAISDDKSLKKHKRSREKSQTHHDSKKRKKEKKHKKKHRKSGDDSKNNMVTEEDSSSLPDVIIVDNDEAVSGANRKSDSEQEEGEISGSEPEQYFGPALPPTKASEEKLYGPSLPEDEDHYGPALPPASSATKEEEKEEEMQGDEDVIGPLPVGQESLAQAALDIRASLLKIEMDNKVSYENEAIQKVPALPFHKTIVSVGTHGLFLYRPLSIAPNSPVWSFLPTFNFFITFCSVPRFGNFLTS